MSEIKSLQDLTDDAKSAMRNALDSGLAPAEEQRLAAAHAVARAGLENLTVVANALHIEMLRRNNKGD